MKYVAIFRKGYLGLVGPAVDYSKKKNEARGKYVGYFSSIVVGF